MKFILGADITVGFQDYMNYRENIYAIYSEDTIGGNIVSSFTKITSINSTPNYFFTRPNHDYSIKVGFKPFIGARIPISNRLVFSFNTSINVGYERILSPNVMYKDHFFMDFSGVVSEVSLFYRF